MKATFEEINEWLAGKKVGNSKSKLNEFVAIVSGEHAGKNGSVISLETKGENPSYIVELESGNDVYVKQSEIEPKNT